MAVGIKGIGKTSLVIKGSEISDGETVAAAVLIVEDLDWTCSINSFR